MGQLGKERIGGLIECEPAVLDEHHRRQRQDGLRHRGDAKDRVTSHRLVAAERHYADRVDTRVVTTGHEGDHAGQLALRDASGHGFV